MDHWGSLRSLLKMKSDSTPVIVHPDVFLPNRFVLLDNGKKVRFPVLKENSLIKAGAQVTKNTAPYLVAEALVLVTGEIERTVTFEKGLPNAYKEREGKVEPDRISDDQALLIHLKGKGLVIITLS